MDWSKYLQQGPLDRPGEEAGAGAAGQVLDVLRDPGREAPPDLRPRPLDAHPQHPRRDDRQQLLRRPLADGPGDRAGPPTRSTSWRSSLYDGTAHDASAPRPTTSWSGSSATAAAGARSTASSRPSATSTPTRSAAASPRTSRAASPATTSTTCCRRRGSTSPGPCRARKGRASPSWRRRLHLVHSPAVKSVLVLGYPDVYSAGDHVTEILQVQADRPGRDGRHPRPRHEEEGHPPARHHAAAEGGGWLLVEFGGESKEESDDKARALMDRLKKVQQPAVDEALRRRGRGRASVEGPRVGPGRDRPDPGRERTPGRAGKTRPCRPTRSAPTSATSASCFDKYGYSCSLYGHFGQGCIHYRGSTSS